ncbi:DUF1360 domain-containing protein [Persicimonas caeni]|uniref:DUF1360 domain-containing protein n=1 Tax=Persicimonas caeni TaxID=2292766 RepID=A0A4Y6PMI0_PERCE|nr:DUF1360 domain-containing protein [Persicimonas caeni]QDG49482.1 DUF1360 domain-containing protein [Persicimonas caeni]QED30703.1 DUF1360 domain-containing protein [Persicimonas caeni]
MTTRAHESGTLDNRNQANREQKRNPEWTGELGREPLPLKGYAALLSIYGTGVTSIFSWAVRNERTLDKVSYADLVVLAMGSQKLARMASKDRVGTLIRQPFTEYDGTDGALPGEASESARRDRGPLVQAIGELLCCPYCTTTWAATAVFGTYLANRKLGRTLAMFLSTVGMADVVQRLYHDVLSHR